MDLADDLAAQAAELFGHLPVDMIGEDEPIEFKTTDQGRLEVRAGSGLYRLGEGSVWRYRIVDGAEEVSCWRKGRQIGKATVTPAVGPTQPELN